VTRSGSAYPERVEILWWLVPPVVVTAGAMVWVSWLGREGRGEVDREQQIERLTRAMEKELPTSRQPRPVRTQDRSTGIAVRPTRAGDASADGRRAS
jgi:hypothetical protein